MRSQLVKLKTFNQSLDMMYIANDGEISKRRVKALQINEGSFQAYCFLRGSKRTFRIDTILALVPVI